jgi:uncharacterized membrane protein YobD (UPF0266 family)
MVATGSICCEMVFCDELQAMESPIATNSIFFIELILIYSEFFKNREILKKESYYFYKTVWTDKASEFYTAQMDSK